MPTKTVADKLQIKPNTTFWCSHPDRAELIGEMPAGVRMVEGPVDATTALLFADDSGALRQVLEAQKDHLTAPSILWVAYPKGNRTDLNRDSLWPIVGEYGLRPNGQVAVDEIWSALRFRANQPGEEPFKGGKQV